MTCVGLPSALVFKIEFYGERGSVRSLIVSIIGKQDVKEVNQRNGFHFCQVFLCFLHAESINHLSPSRDRVD